MRSKNEILIRYTKLIDMNNLYAQRLMIQNVFENYIDK